ncbi:MAG: undecaprenyl diphosphate synthase family protein [Lachnospira sp.]|nr:undecaprenyl diphosphate synthase family protein [Lachnospira sp.]
MYNNNNFHPNVKSFPEHIALIPDGGRRWAKKNNKTNLEAYYVSMCSIVKMIDYSFAQGTKYFSVYLASTLNFKRSDKEVNDFCTAEWEFLNNIFLPYAIENDIKIKIVSADDINIKPFLKYITIIESKTANGKKTVYFCFNYSSFNEIEIAVDKANKTGESFVNYLEIPYPVDILIRTGNANVLSGFLLPQIAMARIFFSPKLFNDFTIDDFKHVVNDYIRYELKYGE